MTMEELLSRFSSLGTNDHDAMIEQFTKVLRCEADVARFFLESSSWNVEMALNAFLSTVGTRNNIYQPETFVLPKAIFDPSGNVPPGQKFPTNACVNVVWRWKNVGETPWPADTCLQHIDGETLGGPAHPIAISCNPGEVCAVPITFRTPEKAGEYGGCWRLVCSSGYFCDPIWLILSVHEAAEAAAENMVAVARSGLGQGTHIPIIGSSTDCHIQAPTQQQIIGNPSHPGPSPNPNEDMDI